MPRLTPMPHTEPPTALARAVAAFLAAQEGRNRSPQTRRAYRTDLAQFVAWLREENALLDEPAEVAPAEVADYLTHLSRRGLSGGSRARKLAAIREFFRYLVTIKAVAESPAAGIDTPKVEKHPRAWLNAEEYTRMLAAAGGHARDFCVLTLFLQTGVRISELLALRLEDVDRAAKTLEIRAGKGMKARTIPLEQKALRALKGWLDVRPDGIDPQLFLDYRGEPLKEWGVRDLLEKYRRAAGITEHVTPHSLRHTYASHKAKMKVSPYMLRELLGHASLNTAMIYTHIAKQDITRVQEATAL